MSTMHSIGRKRVVVVANLGAGGLRRAGLGRKELEFKIAGRALLFTPATLEQLDRCCHEVAAAAQDGLVIAGGDGTILRVLSALRRNMPDSRIPPLVLLPFGTVNTTTKRWGAQSDPWVHFEDYFAGRGSLVPRATLAVGVDGVAYVAVTLGTGLISHFFEEYAQQAKRGRIVASKIFARVFFGSLRNDAYAQRILAPVRGTLTVEGHRAALDAFTLLVCSVLRDVGLGLRPTYRAGSMAGKLHLVATDLEARRLGPQAWRVLLGKALVAPNHVDALVSQFAIEFASPTSVILDGERIVAHHVDVRPGDDLLVFSPRSKPRSECGDTEDARS